MCECGCSSFTENRGYKLGNYIIVIQQYNGCRECHQGLGTDIYILDKKVAKENYDIEIIEEIKPKKENYNFSKITISNVSVDKILESIEKLKIEESDKDVFNFDKNWKFHDLLKDEMFNILNEAAKNEQEKHEPFLENL